MVNLYIHSKDIEWNKYSDELVTTLSEKFIKSLLLHKNLPADDVFPSRLVYSIVK